jgi:acid phosphatase
MRTSSLALFAVLSATFERVQAATRPTQSKISPSKPEIEAAAATAAALSPTSNVKGIAFDRFYQVWLENQNYEAAAGNGDQK